MQANSCTRTRRHSYRPPGHTGYLEPLRRGDAHLGVILVRGHQRRCALPELDISLPLIRPSPLDSEPRLVAHGFRIGVRFERIGSAAERPSGLDREGEVALTRSTPTVNRDVELAQAKVGIGGEHFDRVRPEVRRAPRALDRVRALDDAGHEQVWIALDGLDCDEKVRLRVGHVSLEIGIPELLYRSSCGDAVVEVGDVTL